MPDDDDSIFSVTVIDGGGLPQATELLQGMPVIWVAAMLARLAGFTRILAEDVRCGWVDQVALSPLSLAL